MCEKGGLEAVPVTPSAPCPLCSLPTRLFPLQDGASPIPWSMAERAYLTYVRECGGGGQSLERLAERGGFGMQEFACMFAGHRPVVGHADCRMRADAHGRYIRVLAEEILRLRIKCGEAP